MSPPLVLAITGASGAIYAVRLLDVLLHTGHHVLLTISSSGQEVLLQELGLKVDLKKFQLESLKMPPHFAQQFSALPPVATQPGRVNYYEQSDFRSPMASGSALSAGMVICPCSGSTLSAVAHASGSNLIQRAADVHLKERRKLVLVTRETPLSVLQLDNMRRVAEAGGVVLPAMPGWYHGVRTLGDLVDFIVARILDQLGVPHQLMQRWGEAK